jgi:hypothetical protein
MTHTPQPPVLFDGQQDAGKTSTARYLLSFVDPVPGDRGRSLPTEEREWKAAVAWSRVVLVDNLSRLNAVSSDLLCRVATGGEAVSRALYTDDGSHSSNLHVPVWITAVDPGILRGDLASRMIRIEMEPITEANRLAESELKDKQEAARPYIMRGLLNLTSQIMGEWPSVPKDRLPHRMGDFAIAVRCIDRILSTTGERRLREEAQDLASTVVEGDTLAQLILLMFKRGMNPKGPVTASDLLKTLRRLDEDEMSFGDDKDMPRTPRALSGRLKRVEPALKAAHGVTIAHRRSNGIRTIEITKK